jgi:hypothetical protein
MTPSGAPEVALTLVIPLRAKAGMSLPDFYQYWLNASVGHHSATVVDKLDDAAPDGHDDLVRHLLFLRRRADVPAEELRRFVTETLEPAWAGSPEVLKLRRHLFEPLEATLDHPGMVLYKPPELQYQAAVEVVVADEDALAGFAATPAFTGTADGLAAHCEAVHAARVDRCITTKDRGAITLAGSAARVGGPSR